MFSFLSVHSPFDISRPFLKCPISIGPCHCIQFLALSSYLSEILNFWTPPKASLFVLWADKYPSLLYSGEHCALLFGKSLLFVSWSDSSSILRGLVLSAWAVCERTEGHVVTFDFAGGLSVAALLWSKGILFTSWFDGFHHQGPGLSVLMTCFPQLKSQHAPSFHLIIS